MHLLSRLVGTERAAVFPPTLPPRQRFIAHQVAERLGLAPLSIGEGRQRQLVVWAIGNDDDCNASVSLSSYLVLSDNGLEDFELVSNVSEACDACSLSDLV